MRFRVVRVDGDLLELQPLEGEIEEFRAQDEVELTVIRSRVWSKGYAKGYRDGLDHAVGVIPKARQMGVRDQAAESSKDLIGGHYGHLRVEHGVTLSVDGPDGELKSGIEEEIEKLTGAGLFTAATAADVLVETADAVIDAAPDKAFPDIERPAADRNATAEDG